MTEKPNDKSEREGFDSQVYASAEDYQKALEEEIKRIEFEKTKIRQEFTGANVGGVSIKGWRDGWEDRIGCIVGEDGKLSVVGVGDGLDGGARIASWVVEKSVDWANKLAVANKDTRANARHTLDPKEEVTPPEEVENNGWMETENKDWRSKSFVERLGDKDLLHIEGMITNDEMVLAMSLREVLIGMGRSLPEEVDKMLMESSEDGLKKDKSGSTLVLGVVDHEGGSAIIAWNGDSRAYGVTDDGLVEQLTEDHKPESNKQEDKSRVFNVYVGYEDKTLKPEILILGGEAYKKYKYLVFVSDGVWSKKIDPESIIAEGLKDGELSEREKAERIVMGAFDAGSSDNISAVVVSL